MTDHLPIIGDYDDDDTGARQRGFWGLLAIALVAATIVVILGFVLDRKSSPNSNQANPNLITNFTDGASPLPSPIVSVGPTSPAPTVSSSVRASKTATLTPSRTSSTSSSRSASRSATPTAAASKTKSASPTPTPTPTPSSSPPPYGPCPTAAPCIVGGDFGAIAELVNHYSAAAKGRVSTKAQQCAATQGKVCNTANNYAQFPESSLNGQRAVQDAVNVYGASWISGVATFQVGWAYIPATNGHPGTYVFAIIDG